MAKSLRLNVPKQARGKKLEQEYLSTAETIVHEQTVLRLYEEGKVSTGTAAKMLDMNLYDFMRFAGQHKISVFGMTAKELDEDVRAARRAVKASTKRRKKVR